MNNFDRQIDVLRLENARIMFRNFEGRGSKYNEEGKRNFCVVIPDAMQAQELAAQGWKVRILAPRSDDEEPKHYIPVAVNFNYRPPKIVVITKRSRNELTEETVGMLDQADISNIDLALRPYHWDSPTGSGIKAYLKTMYVTLNEDEFADKYSESENDDYLPF